MESHIFPVLMYKIPQKTCRIRQAYNPHDWKMTLLLCCRIVPYLYIWWGLTMAHSLQRWYWCESGSQIQNYFCDFLAIPRGKSLWILQHCLFILKSDKLLSCYSFSGNPGLLITFVTVGMACILIIIVSFIWWKRKCHRKKQRTVYRKIPFALLCSKVKPKSQYDIAHTVSLLGIKYLHLILFKIWHGQDFKSPGTTTRSKVNSKGTP